MSDSAELPRKVLLMARGVAITEGHLWQDDRTMKPAPNTIASGRGGPRAWRRQPGRNTEGRSSDTSRPRADPDVAAGEHDGREKYEQAHDKAPLGSGSRKSTTASFALR